MNREAIETQMVFHLMSLYDFDYKGEYYLPLDALISVYKQFFDPFYMKLYGIDEIALETVFRGAVLDAYSLGIINGKHIEHFNEFARKVTDGEDV